MNAYTVFEFAVVGLAVALSAWGVARPWLRRRRAAAAEKTGCATAAGGSACGSCGGCASGSTAEQPIRFHR